MGSCAPCPTLLKVWISWLKGGLLLRILGIPAALLALHLEVYGSSPHASSLILHRLARRLRLSKIACQLGNKANSQSHAKDSSDLNFLPRVDRLNAMSPAHSRPTPKTPNWLSRKRSNTPDNSKDRTRRPSPGALPTTRSPKSQPEPLPLPVQHHTEAPDALFPSPPAAPQALHQALHPRPLPSPLPLECAELVDPFSFASLASPAPASILQLPVVKSFDAPAPTPQPQALKPSEEPTPTPQSVTVKPIEIEPTHAPLPNSSATRASLTPKPQPPPIDQVEAPKLSLPASSTTRASLTPRLQPLVDQVEPSKAPLPTSSTVRPPLTPKPQYPTLDQVDVPTASSHTLPVAARPQPPPTALELETFKALLRSSLPASPSPDPRPLPLGRSKTADARSNASVSRSSWTPKSQPHPADAQAFEKFKALLRTSTGSPFSDSQAQPRSGQSSEASNTPSLTASTSILSHTTPTTPMSATQPSAHARSMSYSGAVTRSSKRLSLQFPIQPSPSFTPKLRPQSWVAAPSPMSPSVPIDSSPTETNLLAILAAQERYVLELKEELVKAEEDLKTLKKHWTNNEINKQRNETRKVAQLQPLDTSLANFRAQADDEEGSSTWLHQEMERRKALLSSTKPNNKKKVFSGSRHLRTLSLLSPNTMTANYSPSFPQPFDIRDGIDDSMARPHTLIRHATTPDLTKHTLDNVHDDQFDLGGLTNVQRDAILRTGKKMATDFKDGLFNFIEDIRQATVGEEAIENATSTGVTGPINKNTRKASQGRPPLNKAGSSKKSTSQKTDAIADDFWKEHGLGEPKTAPSNKKTHAAKSIRTPQKPHQGLEEFEDWDNWETPNDKYTKTVDNNSSDDSEEPSSPVSGPSSSRTSTRYHSKRHDSKASSLTSISTTGAAEDAILRDNTKRNSLPWTDLVKLSPGNLKRTASHLMKEWEKSMTPPPESRVSDHSSGDYIGRSTTPPDLI